MNTFDPRHIDESEPQGWQVRHLARVSSTQAEARDLPAWSAVWADEQTAGRGQAERGFVSDPGGIYLTAVLPFDGDALRARGFALAVGRAVWRVLQDAGLRQVRLRWPNDLMAGAVKVGGILVEQGGPQTLLVGLGLNLLNEPWRLDPTLRGVAGRLTDCGVVLPESRALLMSLLQGIRSAHEEFQAMRLAGLAPLLEPCWCGRRMVRLEPAAGVTLVAERGRFCGIDADGALCLDTDWNGEVLIPAHHVGRLIETGAD